MRIPPEQTERIEALQALIERLSDPNVTLPEAKDLRGQLSDLLDCDNRTAGGDRMASCPVSVSSRDIGDGARQNVWWLETSMPVSG